MRRAEFGKRVISLSFILLVTPRDAYPQYTGLEQVLARFEATVAGQVRDDAIGSLAVAVIVGGQVVWTRAYGWADTRTQIPADPRHVYRIGSLTKLFTAVVMMRLAERNVINLDDDVTQVVPELDLLRDRHRYQGSITFRQLASHSAGVDWMPDDSAPWKRVDDWRARLQEIIPKTRILSPPGARARYSNVGYAILGLGLERAARRDFKQLMDDLVIRPLAMTYTGYRLTPLMRASLATGYQNYDDGRIQLDPVRQAQERDWFGVPASSLYSTLEDLARLVASLMATRSDSTMPILADDGLRQLLTLHASPPRQEWPTGYSKGFAFGHTIFHHNSGVDLHTQDGYSTGYSSFLAFEPKSGGAVILLRNYNVGSTNLGRAATTLLVDILEATQRDKVRDGRFQEPR
jgi:CubicO group peptidase (beta-lactamase class C family)